MRSTAAPDQWPNALRSIQNKSVLRGGSDRASCKIGTALGFA
jgi:hypothetical protein